MDMLLSRVLANPHSGSPTSSATTQMIERCRRRVLEFLNASPDEYTVVFTANASQALKLVGESYPFQPGDQFLLTFDNHNSVNGIREFDRARGAETIYLPVRPPHTQPLHSGGSEHHAGTGGRSAAGVRLYGDGRPVVIHHHAC